MPDLLTSAEVERLMEDIGGTPLEIVFIQFVATIIAACQALANSPCLVCHGRGDVFDRVEHHFDICGVVNPPKCWIEYKRKPCPNCGDFPPDRRGKAFERWQDACDSLVGE